LTASDGPYRLENSVAHFGAGYIIREWRLSSWSDRLQGVTGMPASMSAAVAVLMGSPGSLALLALIFRA